MSPRLAAFSAVIARRIEKAVPPQGGFLDLDGERLHVLDKGAGRPVVMIHGLSGQMGNFTHSLVDRLSADFRVVAFDRPGSGYSTRSRGRAGRNSRPGGDAGRARSAKLELENPVIVGHSLGGAVALAIALDHPDCAGALALISPATHPMASTPLVFRGLALLGGRCCAGSSPGRWRRPPGSSARSWGTAQVFAPEPAPADFATRGGGLLALRPGNVYASSSDLMAATRLREDIESMTRRYGSLDPRRHPVRALRPDPRLARARRGDEAGASFARSRNRRGRPHAAGHAAGRLRRLHPADGGEDEGAGAVGLRRAGRERPKVHPSKSVLWVAADANHPA